jgi:hypothetical protein
MCPRPPPRRAINPGDERSLTVIRGQRAPQVRSRESPDGTDFQADNAGSIPVTRSMLRIHSADALFMLPGRTPRDAGLRSRARCVPDWRTARSGASPEHFLPRRATSNRRRPCGLGCSTCFFLGVVEAKTSVTVCVYLALAWSKLALARVASAVPEGRCHPRGTGVRPGPA